MTHQDMLKVKLEQARADATQPPRITVTEYALMMLREAFVAAQASSSFLVLELKSSIHAPVPSSSRLPVFRIDDDSPDTTLACCLCRSRFAICHQALPRREPPSAADAERVEWDAVLKSLARDSVRGYMKLTEPWDMYALISTVIVLVLIRRAAAQVSTPCSPTSTTSCCLACG